MHRLQVRLDDFSFSNPLFILYNQSIQFGFTLKKTHIWICYSTTLINF